MAARMVAIGDSIVNGKTKSVAGVPGRSWAAWVADAAGFEYEQHARGGATSSEIVADLLPLVVGHFDYGVFNMGTNDALKGLDADKLRANLIATVRAMREHCDTLLTLSVPSSPAADAIVRDVAQAHGVAVIDASLSGPRFFQPDRVHPTALGQLEIGDRAASALGTPKPSLTVDSEGRLGFRYWARYGYRWVKFRSKEAVHQWRAGGSIKIPAA